MWDKDSVDLNNKRIVQYVSAKNWVKEFKKNNERLEDNSKPLFTPTTIMETEDDHVYAFVIHKANINSHGKVVFTVSTKEIYLQDNTSKKLTRLPQGECNNMRFDIDDTPSYYVNCFDFCKNSKIMCQSVPPEEKLSCCKEKCPSGVPRGTQVKLL